MLVGTGVLRSCGSDIACSAGNNMTYRLNLKIDSASKVCSFVSRWQYLSKTFLQTCSLKAVNINQSSIYALFVNYDRLWSFFVFI